MGQSHRKLPLSMYQLDSYVRTVPQMELETKEAAASAEEASEAQRKAYQEHGPDPAGSSGRVADAGDRLVQQLLHP